MSKVGEHYRELEEMNPADYDSNDIETHIRCKCAKYWGMHNHKRKCTRCKTQVIARGEIGNNK